MKPIPLRPLWVLFLLSASLFPSQQVLAADASPDPAAPGDPAPSSLADTALIEALNQGYETQAALNERIEQQRKQDQRLAEAIDQQIAAEAAIAVPNPAPASDQIEDQSTLDQLFSSWNARGEGLTQLRRHLEGRLQQTSERRELLLRLIDDGQQLAQRKQRQHQLIGETVARLKARRITREQLDERIVRDVSRNFDKLHEAPGPDPRAAGWQTALERTEELLRQIRERQQRLEQQQAETRDQRQRLEQLQQAFSSSLELRNSLRERGFADLAALYGTRHASWGQVYGQWLEQLLVVRSERERLEQGRAELAALQPPQPVLLDNGNSAHLALREALRAQAQARTALDYRSGRTKLDEQLRTQLLSSIETSETALQQGSRLLTESRELQVLAALMRERLTEPEPGATPDDLPEAVWDGSQDLRHQALNQVQLQLTQDLEACRQQLNQLDEAMAQDQEAAREAEIALEQHNQNVARESKWAVFIEQVQTLAGSELLKDLADSRNQLKAGEQALEQLGQAVAEGREGIATLEARVDSLRDPQVTAQLDQLEAFHGWLNQQQFIPRDGEPESTATNETPANDTSLAGTPGQSASATPAPAASIAPQPDSESSQATAATSPKRSLAERLREQMDREVTPRLLEYRELRDSHKSLSDALERQVDQLEQWIEGLRQQADLARRIWGAANLLQTRVGSGEMKASELPPEISDWTSREPVSRIESQILALRDEQSRLRDQLSTSEQHPMLTLIEPLEQLRENLARQIEQASEHEEDQRAGEENATEEQAAARRFERRVRDRMAADTGTEEELLSLFAAGQSDLIDGLLVDAYSRLLRLEDRQQTQLDDLDRLRALITLNQEQAPILVRIQELVEQQLNAAEERLLIDSARVRALLAPARAEQILAELTQRLPQLQDRARQLLGGDNGELAQLDDQALLETLRDPWARAVGLRAWRDRLQAQTRELGGLDQRTAELKARLGEMLSREQETLRRIRKLTGRSIEELNQLPASRRPRDDQSIRLFLIGEIAELRSARRDELRQTGLHTLGWLALIPALGFLAILLERLFSRRLLGRLRKRNEDEFGEEEARSLDQRHRMLQHVFHVFWVILVTIISVIYMLKAMGLDVIPILASAGVLGLAISFALQDYVRDYFTGFFILFEHHFRPGERVTINGDHGTIERVGPRVTQLRRRHDNALVILPNREILQLINFNRDEGCARVTVPLSYDTNPDDMRDACHQVLEELRADEKWGPMILRVEDEGVENFLDYAQEYQIRIITLPVRQFPLGREFRRRILAELKQRGIEVPQRYYPVA